jgi:isochorismate hydrolase
MTNDGRHPIEHVSLHMTRRYANLLVYMQDYARSYVTKLAAMGQVIKSIDKLCSMINDVNIVLVEDLSSD